VPSGLELVTSTIYDFPSPFEGVFNRKNADYQGTWTHTGGALVFGYRYERQGGLISTRDVGRTNNGGFFHEQYSIGRRLFFTGGARIENSTTFGSRFVPRGSATLQVLADHGPLSATYVRISGGRGFTEPSLLQNFAREAFYVGNPDLRPEKTTMFDAGIVQELFGRRVRAEATYFRNSFRDLIVFDGSLSPASWNNIDRSWARGLETSVTARPFRYLQISGNYTRLYTKITRTNTINPYSGVGQELPRRPKNSGAAWVSISPRRWSLMVGGRAVGERRDTDFVYGITRNPRYGTMFVNASYNLTRHVMPYLRMDNALNERYEEVLGYTALTRSVIGGMRVSW
jgi:vitamin B12 transporter